MLGMRQRNDGPNTGKEIVMVKGAMLMVKTTAINRTTDIRKYQSTKGEGAIALIQPFPQKPEENG